MNVIAGTGVSRHYRWMMALRGVIAVLFGLAAFFWTGLTLLALVYLFGAYALVNGVMAAVVSFQVRSYLREWWVLLLAGIAGIAAGVVAFAWPGITALALLYLIASWAIVTGIFEIAGSFSGWLSVAQEWMLALAGILSVLLGILLITIPAAGILGLVWLIGAYALAYGVLLVIRAFQSRTAAPA